MMHVDKNADGHVLDQNVERISKEIAYVSLNVVHACSTFFFFEKIKNKK